MGQIDITELEKNFNGTLIRPSDPEYDTVRTVWNAMVDHRPAIIARCKDRRDVVAALNFGQLHNLEIGVRCGGHSIIGHSVPEENGIMIDLSLMNAVQVDPVARRAFVQGGSLLANLDREASKYGLATTAGNVSHTGVGGLTLTGGMGWLARQFGLACDNVISFELVTANGEVLRVDENTHANLFWGLRGGGGNFGIVTEFEFRLHPIGGRAIVADLTYALKDAEDVLHHWRGLLRTAPREATLGAWTGIAAASLSVPPEFHGEQVLRIGYVWVGNPEEGKQYVSNLRNAKSPIAEQLEEVSYVELQSMDDSTREEYGLRRYWKGHYFRELSDEAIRVFLARGSDGPSNEEESRRLPSASLQAYGGAIADIAPGATAFSHRDALFDLTIFARWEDPAEDEKRIGDARRYSKSLEPFADGIYIHATNDEDKTNTAALGVYSAESLARLAALKRKYDPENIFHRNANIMPAED